MTDPISDMLARIRNAILARKAKVQLPASKLKHEVARVLKDEGFVNDVSFDAEGEHKQGVLTIELRYDNHNHNAISGLRRRSRPGQRVYASHDQLPKIRSGLGIAIITTSKGVMTDRSARKAKIGGELLCEVW